MKSTISAGWMLPNTGLKYTGQRAVRPCSVTTYTARYKSLRLPTTIFTLSFMVRQAKFSGSIWDSIPLHDSL